ncbi:MAG: DNA mismatch repair protein MutS [Burkholderiaceae bacterium]|jgi:DNA-nicking Smr family endonuclease|nr:DNA mismatch repair protein MutS [Burkholderiaceae bacterium]
MKLTSLKDLQHVQRHLAEVQALAARREAERREVALRHQAEKELFTRAVGAVKTLPDPRKAHLKPPPPAPVAFQQQLDDQAVLREALSDEFDVSTLLETDAQLSFRRPGIGPDVTRKLRRGEWSIQRELDLHGLRIDDAREALGGFIREAFRQGLRCVRVVHGKGLGSPGKAPVLKSRVQGWLIQKNEVLAFVQAKPAEGGAGALLVLLQGSSGSFMNKNKP